MNKLPTNRERKLNMLARLDELEKIALATSTILGVKRMDRVLRYFYKDRVAGKRANFLVRLWRWVRR